MFNEILIRNNAPLLGCLGEWKNENERKHGTPVASGTLLERMRSFKGDISEKTFGHISSFNFNRGVFTSSRWNDLNVKARGLFIDNQTGRIVARGYEKFFAYKEGKFNSPEWLEENLSFPVEAYEKYNGFLGLLGFDDDGLLFCSKSTIGGEYAEIFKRIFRKHCHCENELLDFMKNKSIGLVFEVIDPVNDPHIVEYSNERIVLLDAISLEEQFSTRGYDELDEIANRFNFIVKNRASIFNDWHSLRAFLEEQESNNVDCKEGYVLSDSNNYHFKLKTRWYKFWKWMRTMKEKVLSGHQINLNGIDSPDAIRFIGWMMKQDKQWLGNCSIIEARKKFFEDARNHFQA